VVRGGQVHDEVILEGPKENAEDAQQRLVYLMAHPFYDPVACTYTNPLLVELAVDSKIADTWYEAK
jgi:DNA polymerase I